MLRLTPWFRHYISLFNPNHEPYKSYGISWTFVYSQYLSIWWKSNLRRPQFQWQFVINKHNNANLPIKSMDKQLLSWGNVVQLIDKMARVRRYGSQLISSIWVYGYIMACLLVDPALYLGSHTSPSQVLKWSQRTYLCM